MNDREKRLRENFYSAETELNDREREKREGGG
jgi:hypothetical protein